MRHMAFRGFLLHRTLGIQVIEESELVKLRTHRTNELFKLQTCRTNQLVKLQTSRTELAKNGGLGRYG